MKAIIEAIEKEIAREATNRDNGYGEGVVELTEAEARAILTALKGGQAYADAYRAWHGIGQRQDCSAASMKRFKATRDSFHAAYEETP